MNIFPSSINKDNQLKVASLNFSGVNVSPFEYHDGSQQKDILDKAFKSFLDTFNHNNPNTDWNIAKIDKIFQKERYSILYQSDCGCVRNRLLTKEQFELVWDRTYQLNQGIVSHLNLSDEKINKLRSFDYMLYQAYLQSLFGNTDIRNLNGENIELYKSELKRWHSKSYLNINLKIKYVRQYIIKQNIDVLFLQEALTERAKQYLPNDEYCLVKNAESMIIYRRQAYFMEDSNDLQKFDEKYKELLNFNKDSCYLKAKDILLISVHLSSKSANIQQAKNMFKVLQDIQEENKNLKIIIGIDANHKLQGYKNFKLFPETSSPTTRKKRTSMQCQFQKSNKLVEESKDCILTNVGVLESRVEMIHSFQVTQNLLPNDNHPFDHFLVYACLEFDKKEFRNRSSSIIKNFINPMIRILVEGGQNKSSNRTFQEIVGELVARIVPPEAGEPFRGFKLMANHENVLKNGLACLNSGRRPHSQQQVNSPINFDNHHLINWDGIKHLGSSQH